MKNLNELKKTIFDSVMSDGFVKTEHTQRLDVKEVVDAFDVLTHEIDLLKSELDNQYQINESVRQTNEKLESEIKTLKSLIQMLAKDYPEMVLKNPNFFD